MSASIFDDTNRLAVIDAQGYRIIEAISVAQSPPVNSLSNPHSFNCLDANEYWAKSRAQDSLESELIAGRLAVLLGIGPVTEVIHVPRELTQNHPTASHLFGIIVGIRNVPGCINVKNIAQIAPGLQLTAANVDSATRARAVAFHTWLGLEDPQILLDLGNGKVTSIDHGGCFRDVGNQADPALIVIDIPGVARNHGCEAGCVKEAVERIESTDDTDIMNAIARIPNEPNWNADPNRRLAIGRWLSRRRPLVREVMRQWK